MAGFDFEFRCTTSDRALARALLEALREMTSARGLTLRYRWQGVGYWCGVDGALVEMQALLFPAHVYLSGVARGFASPRVSQRRRLCHRILGELSGGVDRISEGVSEVADFIGGSPNSYFFDVGTKTHLAGPAKAFTDALISYHHGLISPSAFAEACHTALEIFMKSALPSRPRCDSFEGLARAAAEAGLITEKQLPQLLELKKFRRDAKHRGQGISPDRISELEPVVRTVCHVLCRHVSG